MMSRVTSLSFLLEAVAVSILLFICLFADTSVFRTEAFISSVMNEISTAFRDAGTQWIFFYFWPFIFSRWFFSISEKSL